MGPGTAMGPVVMKRMGLAGAAVLATATESAVAESDAVAVCNSVAVCNQMAESAGDGGSASAMAAGPKRTDPAEMILTRRTATATAGKAWG